MNPDIQKGNRVILTKSPDAMFDSYVNRVGTVSNIVDIDRGKVISFNILFDGDSGESGPFYNDNVRNEDE